MNAPATLDDASKIVWPITLRIVLVDCATDIAKLHPSGVAFTDPMDVTGAEALAKDGYLSVSNGRYSCTRKGWDLLGDNLWRVAP